MDDDTWPMIVKVITEKMKNCCIRNTNELKFACDKFKGISFAHYLTPRDKLGLKKFTKVTLTITLLFSLIIYYL